jgi:glutamate N-acetyltransferase/amino-acid N-acetyltransferase
VAVLANGLAGNPTIHSEGEDFKEFCDALRAVTSTLCKGIAKDGEGATKLLECIVSGAPDKKAARKVAKTVIQSELVKTAIFGEDANWGRILCAVGYSDADFSVDNVDIVISSVGGNIDVCRHSVACVFDESLAKRILAADEIKLLVSLNQGQGGAIAYGCDMTYDYVRINGRYRT